MDVEGVATSEARDEDLALRSVSGDRAAFAALVERYLGRIHVLATIRTGSVPEAQDLAQETFARAHANLARLRRPDRFGPWLYGILRTTAREWSRRRRRERLLPEPDETPGRVPREVSGLEERERAEAVARALAALPERVRVVVVLRYLDGWSAETIASHLKKPSGTIRSILSRSRRVLQEALAEWKP